jgi:hypothetical protein
VGWLAGCIRCIVQPGQASGGPKTGNTEMYQPFLGVGEHGGRVAQSPAHYSPRMKGLSFFLHGSRHAGRTHKR